MNEQRELDLLVDLTRLLKKYGPETFEKLADDLQRRRLTSTMAVALDKIIDVHGMASRKPPAKRKVTRQRPRRLTIHRDSLLAIAKDDEEKSRLLVSFWDDLQAKRRLPRSRDLVDFARDNDLPHLTASSRERTLSVLMEHFMTLPADRLRTLMQRAPVANSSEKGSLEAWTRVILHKDVQSPNSR